MFDTVTGSRLCEFRRGADNAEIYSIAFHPDSTFLAVSSDKGTIHIYKIQRDSGEVAGAGYTSLHSLLAAFRTAY